MIARTGLCDWLDHRVGEMLLDGRVTVELIEECMATGGLLARELCKATCQALIGPSADLAKERMTSIIGIFARKRAYREYLEGK